MRSDLKFQKIQPSLIPNLDVNKVLILILAATGIKKFIIINYKKANR